MAIALLLGVDRSRWRDFRVWSHDVTALFGVRSLPDLTVLTTRALPNILALRNLLVAELRQRRDSDVDDILGRLRQALHEGQMTAMEALSAAMLLLVAGNETTTNLLGILLLKLARDPELYARLGKPILSRGRRGDAALGLAGAVGGPHHAGPLRSGRHRHPGPVPGGAVLCGRKPRPAALRAPGFL